MADGIKMPRGYRVVRADTGSALFPCSPRTSRRNADYDHLHLSSENEDPLRHH